MNLDNAKEIKEPGQPFYNNPTGFALHKFCYYICYKCQVTRCKMSSVLKPLQPHLVSLNF
jgi:hypothetical protein